MKCDEIKQLLIAYLDGELSAEQAAAVQQHLADCPDCAREHRLLQCTWEMLLEDDDVEPSPDFARNFWHRVRGAEPHEELSVPPGQARARLRRVLTWAPALAAGFTIAFLAGWFVGGAGQQNGTDAAFLHDYEMIQEIDLLENLPVLQVADINADINGEGVNR